MRGPRRQGARSLPPTAPPRLTALALQGYPTIKFGDPDNLEDYKGKRELEELRAFASSDLQRVCSVRGQAHCTEAQRAHIARIQAMPDAELDAAIAGLEADRAAAEARFAEEVEKLQGAYKALTAAKEATLKEVKDSGLATMKKLLASPACLLSNTARGCSERELTFIDKMRGATSDERAKQLGRLERLRQAGMKPELAHWVEQRLRLLRQM